MLDRNSSEEYMFRGESEDQSPGGRKCLLIFQEYGVEDFDLLKNLLLMSYLQQPSKPGAFPEESPVVEMGSPDIYIVQDKKFSQTFLVSEYEDFITLDKIIDFRQSKNDYYSEEELLYIYDNLLAAVSALQQAGLSASKVSDENIAFGLRSQRFAFWNTKDLVESAHDIENDPH